jgi:hypothetical protein
MYHNADYLVFNILFDEYHKHKFYDKEFNFSLINYLDVKKGTHRIRQYQDGDFGPYVNMKFDFLPNFLEVLYPEALKCDEAWIEKCDEVRKESRAWGRKSHQQNPKFTWAEQVYHLQCKIFYHKILNNQVCFPDNTRLKEMEELGEEAYTAKYAQQNAETERIAKEILDEIEQERKDKAK